jgi:hypothetical protein
MEVNTLHNTQRKQKRVEINSGIKKGKIWRAVKFSLYANYVGFCS